MHGSFPEVLEVPNSATGVSGLSGTLGQMLAGRIDLSGNIKYNADLYDANGAPVPSNQIEDFLQTMTHEMQHLNEGLLDRIGLSTGELLNYISPQFPSIEDIIDHNADIIYRFSIGKFRACINAGQ
jgi:hypothetical protein